jgi:hypothetical protein
MRVLRVERGVLDEDVAKRMARDEQRRIAVIVAGDLAAMDEEADEQPEDER